MHVGTVEPQNNGPSWSAPKSPLNRGCPVFVHKGFSTPFTNIIDFLLITFWSRPKGSALHGIPEGMGQPKKIWKNMLSFCLNFNA